MKKVKFLFGLAVLIAALLTPVAATQRGGVWVKLFTADHGLDCGGASGGCYYIPKR